MDSRIRRQYSARDVRVALQLLHNDPGPLILAVRHDEEQLAQGYPPVTRMCSCCGGTFHDGTVIRVDELLTVSDDRRFRCTRCEGLRAELRIPWEEIQRIRDRERAREAGEDYPPQRPWDDGRDPREAGSHRWVANTDAARRYHGGAPDDV